MFLRITYDDESRETIQCSEWGFNEFGMLMIYDEDSEEPKKVVNSNAFLTIDVVEQKEHKQ